MYPTHPLYEVLRSYCTNDTRLFLVGGTVRDFLRGYEGRDFDFLLEGELFSFCEGLKEFSGKQRVNRRLLTVSFQTSWGAVDFAQARREIYHRPGALPKVEPASWQEDLRRRDFTVNSLAWPLRPSGWGDLVDITGGLQDLQEGLIRVLHKNSFRDDPTRLLRAVRYCRRLGYSLEERTRSLLRRDWEYLRCVSPPRRLKEWQLMCDEPSFPVMLDDLYSLGGWEAFIPGIPYQTGWKEHFLGIDTKVFPRGFRRWFFYLLELLKNKPEQLPRLAAYWGIGKKDYLDLERSLEICGLNGLKSRKMRELSLLVKPLPPEGKYLLYREVFSKSLSFEEFNKKLCLARMPLNGKDLLAMGYSTGPELGNILHRLEELYLKGAFNSKEEGQDLLRRVLYEED